MNIKNIDTGNYQQFSSCSDVLIESISTADPVNGQKRKKIHHYQRIKNQLTHLPQRSQYRIKHNDNKAEGSANYVKDTLTSSSLEMVAGTESAGSNGDVNSSGYNRACTTSHQIDLGKEDDDQPLFLVGL
ncbi:unnamed protein product [Rhizophagus irregularis]|nr:unnamed protein product [Rhizophagus irregularis]